MSLNTDYVNAAGLRVFIDRFGSIPREVHAELRPRLRAAGRAAGQEAAQRASWSSRIPGAITVRTSLSKKNPGVFLRVNQTKAPHARSFEGITGASTFRHPVHGHRDRWVTQRTRPFLVPAVRATREAVRDAVTEAVQAAMRKL